jgi:hypothetical protein
MKRLAGRDVATELAQQIGVYLRADLLRLGFHMLYRMLQINSSLHALLLSAVA